MSSRGYFDQVAGEWNSLRAGFFSEAVRERAVDALRVVPGKRAADVGAGTGFMTEELLARGLDVIAIDESDAMLAELQRSFPAARCLRGESTALPLEDGAVDYAVANMYLHHVESPAAAIAEMARVLAPGGALAITDLDAHDYQFLRHEHHDRWLGFEHGDVRAWLDDAGLRDIEITPVGTSCSATSSSGEVDASIAIFLATAQQPHAG